MKIIGRTDVGRVRRRNEDAFAFDAEIGVAVLADGMGGLDAGDVASREAADVILEHLRAVDARDCSALVAAVRAANRRVFDLSQSDGGAGTMGTTVVVWALLDAERFAVAHVGDSRVYRIRRSGLERLTRDHSLVQDMVDQGFLSAEEARGAPNRNVITRAVGLEADVSCDAVELERHRNDLFLLCSDGLTDMLSEQELGALCRGATMDRLPELAEQLIDAANAAGGADNITVLLLG